MNEFEKELDELLERTRLEQEYGRSLVVISQREWPGE